MTMEGMGLTPLESNLHKNDLVVISQIMQMIEEDNFWHLKTNRNLPLSLGGVKNVMKGYSPQHQWDYPSH